MQNFDPAPPARRQLPDASAAGRRSLDRSPRAAAESPPQRDQGDGSEQVVPLLADHAKSRSGRFSQPRLSNSLAPHRLHHHIATHRLHEIVKQTPAAHRLANLSKGHTVRNLTLAFHKAQNTPTWAEGRSPAMLQPMGRYSKSFMIRNSADNIAVSSQANLTNKSQEGSKSSAGDKSTGDQATGSFQDPEFQSKDGKHTVHQVDGHVTDEPQPEDPSGESYCLSNFLKIIDNESAPCLIPPHITDIAHCNCGSPCAMRTLLDEDLLVWVCFSRQCTFLADVSQQEAWTQEQEVFESQINDIQSPEDFWALASDMMALPETDVCNILLTLVKDRPLHCFCCENIGVAICINTGDIYWKCDKMKCVEEKIKSYFEQRFSSKSILSIKFEIVKLILS